MHNKNLRKMSYLAGISAAAALIGLTSAQAGDVTYDFTTDPSGVLTIAGNNDAPYVSTGGNPGGFLALTYAQNSQYAAVVFPNLDPGKIVTGFTFTCDLRVGNSAGDRAADGFSISFARDGDAVLTDPSVDTGFAGNCCAEMGTKSGIAVSFDTWSGNTFASDPADTSDIEGIIVRVDNATVRKVALPTRHGTADDITSLQTGPRDAAFWAAGGDPRDPASWATLGWRPFSITMTTDAKLTVSWKGNKIVDNLQTTFFPSAGQLVFAGRTGGANENTHVDNIRLTTIAEAVTALPGAPGNFRATAAGANQVALAWDAAVVAGDPNARIAYDVLRGDTVIASTLTTTTFVDRGVAPGKSYSYKVRGKNIAGNAGPDANLTVQTANTVPGLAFTRADIWFNIGTVDPANGIADPHFADAPDATRYLNGFSFGLNDGAIFGNSPQFGDNFITVISGVFTAPKSGNFRFFGRADDGVSTYLNTSGPAIPNVTTASPIQVTDGSACCKAFQDIVDGVTPPETSEPIALTAGQQYGIAFVVKEGGGGDWGQLAIREEGDPTPAGNLPVLRGSVISGPVDAVGASVSITTQPTSVSVGANSPVTFTAAATGTSAYGADYGNVVSYQWYKNGVAILGANNPTYTIAVTPKSDNNAKFKVVAAVAGANVSSTEATLTVNDDTTPPTVTRISGSDGFNSITFVFSEPVTDSALTVGNYTVTGLSLSAPTRLSDRSVSFTTSTQAEKTVYPVTVNGVRDNANLASAFTGSFNSYEFKTGIAQFSRWDNQTGGFETFADLGAASSVAIVTEFYSGSGLAENYFGQLKGYFIPETTGDYVFFTASDDHGELYLSTDANPANKKKIAEEPSWSDPRLWNGDGTASNTGTRGEVGSRANRSDEYPGTEWSTGAGGKISLTAGNRYYIEVLYKEGGGGDHGAATFKLASAADPANGATALTGARIGYYVDPTTLPPIITKRPVGVKFAKGGAVSFSVEATSALPVTYQWYHNKKAIAGANTATLSIPSAGVADVGDYYVDVTNANGTVSSFPDNDSRAVMTGAFVIEAEDYNYDGGKNVTEASTMPLAANLYRGKDGLPGIDFHLENQSTADGAANGNNYRQGWTEVPEFPTAPEEIANADVVSDDGNGNTERPDFVLANNYKIGWGNTGEWYQYTRNFTPGKYNVVAGYSRDGRDADNFGLALELVTGDITKVGAATTVVAQVTLSGTGGWSSNDLVPFLAPGSSSLAEVDLGANTTVRLRLSQNDPDIDFLLFYPVGTTTTPVITGVVQNPNGSITITWTGGGQLEASTSLNGTYAPVPGATGGTFTWTPGATDSILFARVR